VSLQADLTSTLSTLEQVLERLEEAAGALDGDEREDLLVDLHEVERHVRAAARRLDRTVAALAGT
jgi:hypothetical protein